MNRIILAALFSLPLVAQAELITERKFEHRIEKFSKDGFVEIDNLAGEVKVFGTRGSEIVISGNLEKNIEGVEVERNGENISIVVKHKNDEEDKHWHNRNGDAKLEISLPAGVELNVSGVSSDIEVEAVTGEQRLKTVSGDVETDAYSADVFVTSVSGDVRVVGTGGDSEEVKIESVSGEVHGSQLHGDISATSVSGDVVVRDSEITSGRFSSTSGDIDVSGSIAKDSKLEFDSVSGDIEFQIQGKTDGSYDFNTFSGDIDNCFGPEVDDSRRNKRLRFEIGNARVSRVRASTMSGDIAVCD